MVPDWNTLDGDEIDWTSGPPRVRTQDITLLDGDVAPSSQVITVRA